MNLLHKRKERLRKKRKERMRKKRKTATLLIVFAGVYIIGIVLISIGEVLL